MDSGPLFSVPDACHRHPPAFCDGSRSCSRSDRSASGIRRLSGTGGSATAPYRERRFSRTCKRLVESRTYSHPLVSSVLLFRLALVLRQVLLIKKGSCPVSAPAWDDLRTSSGYLLRRILLRESGSIAVPLTIGFWRPALILPLGWEHWEGWKLRAVLTHELTHIRRLDWQSPLLPQSQRVCSGSIRWPGGLKESYRRFRSWRATRPA